MITDLIYCGLLEDILDFGKKVKTRNSQVIRRTGLSVNFDSTPLISIRKTAWKSALREWEWFMSGSNNIKDLHVTVRKWWEPWATEDGWIHNNYSKQFRRFDGAGWLGPLKNHHSVDQIQYMIDTLKKHPYSRRNAITTWHTHDMISPNTAISNCHGSLIQCFVDPETDKIEMIMYQRSADMILGLPHNIIQYWAFLMYLAHTTGRKVGNFTWIGGDCHIYEDHIIMAEKITHIDLLNENNSNLIDTPELIYNPTSEEFKANDFSLNKEYKPVINENLKMVV